LTVGGLRHDPFDVASSAPLPWPILCPISTAWQHRSIRKRTLPSGGRAIPQFRTFRNSGILSWGLQGTQPITVFNEAIKMVECNIPPNQGKVVLLRLQFMPIVPAAPF